VRTGRGQKVDTSLFAALISLLSVQGQRFLSLGEVPPLAGNVHPVIAPYGVFRAGDGEMNIGAATQNMWLSLCDVVGRPEWKNDPRFAANAQRMANRDELKRLIEEELAKATRDAWTARFVAAGIPAGPINTIEDAIESEQVKHMGLIESISLGLRGNFRQITNPIRLSNKTQDGWMRSGPAMLGQHTREVLAELGFTSSQIADWETSSVVYQTSDA
jgi:crotonobetainyl-CoA:carnitine CoA-transferase CaiB-like acyl-CoA transferase